MTPNGKTNVQEAQLIGCVQPLLSWKAFPTIQPGHDQLDANGLQMTAFFENCNKGTDWAFSSLLRSGSGGYIIASRRALVKEKGANATPGLRGVERKVTRSTRPQSGRGPRLWL